MHVLDLRLFCSLTSGLALAFEADACIGDTDVVCVPVGAGAASSGGVTTATSAAAAVAVILDPDAFDTCSFSSFSLPWFESPEDVDKGAGEVEDENELLNM